MRILLLAALFLVSCEKETEEVTPTIDPLSKMVFHPHYNASGVIIGTRFTVPFTGEKITLTKYGKVIDTKLNVLNNAYLYDTITNKFPQHDSVFVFTMISKGDTTTSAFKVP
jgi:hypothetical protein